MRRFSVAAAVLGLAVFAAAQSGELHTAGGVIRLKNFSHFASDVAKGETKVKGEGHPVSIEDTASGLTLVADSIDCTFVQDAKGNYLLEHAILLGDGLITLDTDVAETAKANRAKLEGKPAPSKPRRSSVLHLASDEMDYTADERASTVTFAKSVDMTEQSKGTFDKIVEKQSADFAFVENTHATGTRGLFVFASRLTNPSAPVDPRTGHLAGPVTFTFDRSEVPAVVPIGAPVPVPKEIKVNGLGDQLDENFVGPDEPTVILDGNIKIDGDGLGFSGVVTGSRAVLTLDRKSLEPKTYEFTGGPATTVIKLPPAKIGTAKTPGGRP